MKITSNLIVPRVNINGNHREELVEQLTNASDKLLDALHALQACEYSNGRNFQTHSAPKAAQEAREQHSEWNRTLFQIQSQVMKLAIAIDEQG